MKTCDTMPPSFLDPSDSLDLFSQVSESRPYLRLPPDLYDLNPESPLRRLRQMLDWVAEAKELLAAQQERIAHLEALTTTDELTGLLNRRGFAGHFKRELAHAQRDAGAHGVLVMIDLDNFKTINDTLGHDAGDAMLRRVSVLLGHLVRRQDVVARLGGDEFVVLLTSVDPAQGEARARTLAAALRAESASWNGQQLPVTLSFGAAPYGVGDREDQVLRRADSAMYIDKESRGRGSRRRKAPASAGR